jgi:hypothetical protein
MKISYSCAEILVCSLIFSLIVSRCFGFFMFQLGFISRLYHKFLGNLILMLLLVNIFFDYEINSLYDNTSMILSYFSFN